MLSCSVAVYNPNLEYFEKMLISLKKYTPQLKQLLVVDNGSTDKSFFYLLEKHFPDEAIQVDVLEYKTNRGFGFAHNEAVKRATYDLFAVLNDDIEFFEDWSSPMVDKLCSDKSVAQVGMKNNVCNMWRPDGTATYKDTDNPDYIEGSCFMMWTAQAKSIGPFDPIYQFAYWEDGDLSLRLKKAGFNLATVDVKWIHHRAKTSSRVDVDIAGYHVNNEYKFKQRWQSYLLRRRFGKTIVIKREGSHGDVLLATPVAEALKEKYPDCVILFMTRCKETLLNNPLIDAFVEMHSPVACDILVDLDYSYERKFDKHIVDYYAETAQVEVKKKVGTLVVEKNDLEYVTDLLKGVDDFITVDLSDTWVAKEWSADKYQELVARFKKDGQRVVALGTSDKYKGFVDLDRNYLNSLTLQQTALVIRLGKLHIGHEGVFIHFCQSMNKPHIPLYGCTSPDLVNDKTLPSWFGVVSPLACVGCRHRFMAGTTVICKRGYACMKAITVDMVYNRYLEAKAFCESK